MKGLRDKRVATALITAPTTSTAVVITERVAGVADVASGNARATIHHIDRRDLIPLDKGRALDSAKVAAIAASMAEGGWQGRPLLGVWSGPGRYLRPVRDRRYRIDGSEAVHLMTGSHRHAAARRAKMRSIPVYLIDASAHAWTIYDDGVVDADGWELSWWIDEERRLAIEDIDDPDASELMAAEVAGNYSTFSLPAPVAPRRDRGRRP